MTIQHGSQIVLPGVLRTPVIEIAQENVAGDLGIMKTRDKIMSHFYRPAVRKDVASFVNLCHTCQVADKPNQTIPP